MHQLFPSSFNIKFCNENFYPYHTFPPAAPLPLRISSLLSFCQTMHFFPFEHFPLLSMGEQLASFFFFSFITNKSTTDWIEKTRVKLIKLCLSNWKWDEFHSICRLSLNRINLSINNLPRGRESIYYQSGIY